MAREAVYNWAAPDKSAICALQTIAGAGSLLINGTLSALVPPYASTYAVNLGNISRKVSITSPAGGPNLAGVNFTIVGTNYTNTPVSETLAGPGANATVQTTAIFKTVTSVSVSAAVTGLGVSLGTGNAGTTDWFWVDHYTAVENLGLRAALSAPGAVDYSFDATLNDVERDVAYGRTPDTFSPVAAMTGPATTSQFAQTSQPMRFCRFTISATAGSATFRILQQGLL